MLARLAMLFVILTCATACATTARTATGNFCRLYQPVPLEEGSGPAIEANEITYCVLCDPQCPDRIIRAWQERRP